MFLTMVQIWMSRSHFLQEGIKIFKMTLVGEIELVQPVMFN